MSLESILRCKVRLIYETLHNELWKHCLKSYIIAFKYHFPDCLSANSHHWAGQEWFLLETWRKCIASGNSFFCFPKKEKLNLDLCKYWRHFQALVAVGVAAEWRNASFLQPPENIMLQNTIYLMQNDTVCAIRGGEQVSKPGAVSFWIKGQKVS